VAVSELGKWKEELKQNRDSAGYYTRWARWFFADRATRTLSPASLVTVPQYIQQRIKENTLDSLREAVRLLPTNALAVARLAAKTLAESPDPNSREAAEAAWLTQRAVALAPNDPTVLKIRAEITRRLPPMAKP
jgi:hypothetical protein